MTFNPGGNVPPTYKRDIEGLQSEIRKLWQRVAGTKPEPKPHNEITYSWGGTVNPDVNTYSQRWVAPFAIDLTSIRLTLSDASNVNLIVRIYVNDADVSAGGYTLTAGETNMLFAFGTAFSLLQEDVVQLRLTAAVTGTGESLGAIITWIRS